MKFQEDVLEEDREFEEFILKQPPTVLRESFTKFPTRILQCVEYQLWRATMRASVSELLYSYAIRQKMDNAIANYLFKEYYLKRHLIVSRFTHQGIATLLGCKSRSGITTHMQTLEKEGIFKVHTEYYKNRLIRVYEFGKWVQIPGTNDKSEILHLFVKFNKIKSKCEIDKALKKI